MTTHHITEGQRMTTPNHPTPDTPIRTHASLVGDSVPMHRDLAGFLPPDWEPGTPVLVVAGLPEGATIRRRCDLDETWEFQGYGEWVNAGGPTHLSPLVVCAPVPVPAPPATERVPWHEAIGRRITASDGEIVKVAKDARGVSVECVTGSAFLIEPTAGMVEVLVEAPTGDDKPDCACGHPDADAGCHFPSCATGNDEPQADTPAPQGRWTVDSDSVGWQEAGSTFEMFVTRTALAEVWRGFADGKQVNAAFDALVDLVRRDGTDPTAEERAVIAAAVALAESWAGGALGSEAQRALYAAVGRLWNATSPEGRALRDGATR